jgi:hypothetical protein
LSHQTNLKIGKRSPADYLVKIEKEAKVPSEVLDDIIRSHSIDPKHLRSADFESFFSDRTEALLVLVEVAMGKRAVREDETWGEDEEDATHFDLGEEELDDEDAGLFDDEAQ